MKNIYMTFDMDWACDDVLQYFYEEICRLQIRGTLNVTNDSRVLNEIRKDGRPELGIHPNFNNLLYNKSENENIDAIIKGLKEIVPEAVTERSHSLVTGSQVNKCLYENGILYESNFFYELSDNIKMNYYEDYMGLKHIPFFFEDDFYLMNKNRKNISDYFQGDLLVFNFHPIHLFLNTENVKRYENAKKYYHKYSQLKTCRNMLGWGIRSCFEELVMMAHERGYSFKMLREIGDEE